MGMIHPILAWKNRKELAGALLYWSGAAHVFEALTRPTGAIILMYHSVAPREVAEFIDPANRITPEEFEAQMAFLHRHRRVISLTQLLTQLDAGEQPPAGTVCITFDDGYRDTLTTAAPVLEKFKLPAALFVPTAYIERAETQWADTLYRVFHQRTANRLVLPELALDVDLARKRQTEPALARLHEALLASTYSERSKLLQEVDRQLESAGPSPRLTMNWDELRELVRRYEFVEIGGHSRNHIDLSRHRGELARDEIRGCAEDLRRELGQDPQHFCFPYGRWCVETSAEVRSAGWRSAMAEGVSFRVGPSSDRHLLARSAAPRLLTALRFQTSGAFPGALAMLGMRYHER
jgi:peptidoglycan/xylan/chitin deacetylase (PgdA/CDA1 family)